MLPYAITCLVASLAIGALCVLYMGEAACLLAGIPLSISVMWIGAIALNAREISSDLYAEVAEIRNPDYRGLIRARMSDGRLTYAELASAKNAFEAIEQNREAKRLASRLG